jgi:hypothetical protein
VFVLKRDKSLCFDRLLQVLILNELGELAPETLGQKKRRLLAATVVALLTG